MSILMDSPLTFGAIDGEFIQPLSDYYWRGERNNRKGTKKSKKNYLISYASKKDFSAIVSLYNNIRRNSYFEPIHYIEAAIKDGRFEDMWNKALDDDNNRERVVKIEVGGQLVAFMRCGQIAPPVSVPNSKTGGKKWGALRQIYVHDAFRQNGWGKLLFKKAEHELMRMGCTHMFITAIGSNDKGRIFYERHGAKLETPIMGLERCDGKNFFLQRLHFSKRLAAIPQ